MTPRGGCKFSLHYSCCAHVRSWVMLVVARRAAFNRQVRRADMLSLAVGWLSLWSFETRLLTHRSAVGVGVRPLPACSLTASGCSRNVRFANAQRASPDSDSSKQTVHSCHSISGPLLQRRKHPEQGGCGDAACGSWPARDVRSHQPATKSRVTCKRGLRGCSLWKLACERFSIQQYQRSNIANRLQKGVSGEAACGSWPARDRHISPANPLCYAFQSSIRIRRAQHCNASRTRPPPRPNRTSRATPHALHVRT